MVAGGDGLDDRKVFAAPFVHAAAVEIAALEAGDAATARDLHRLWYPFRALAREFGQPQTTKAAMNLRGFGGGAVRPPLRNLETVQIAAVAEVLQKLAADRRSNVGLAA